MPQDIVLPGGAPANPVQAQYDEAAKKFKQAIVDGIPHVEAARAYQAMLTRIAKGAGQLSQGGAGRDFGDSPMPTSNAAIAGMAKGATLGFADEALGAIDAANQFLPKAIGGEGVPLTNSRSLSDLVTGTPGTGGLQAFTSRYQQTRDKVRGTMAQASQEHPVATTVGDVAGGVMSALPVAAEGAVAKLAGKPALSLGRQIAIGAGQAAKVGAAYGAVAGAGNAEGSLVDRGIGAASGGVTGAVLGGALGALSPVAGKALTELRDLIGRRQIAAGTRAAADAREAVLSSITDPAERQAIERYIASDPILGPAFNERAGVPATNSGPRLKARTGSLGGIPAGRTSDNPFIKQNPLEGTKVVDEAGQPKRVFHGTASAFDSFDPQRLDKNGLYGPGIYWTEDAGVAGGYSTKGTQGLDHWTPAQLEERIATRDKQLLDPNLSPVGRAKLLANNAADKDLLRVHQSGGPSPNVRPARLAIKNPFDADERVAPDAARRIADIAERVLGPRTAQMIRAEIDAGTPILGKGIYQLLSETGSRVTKADANAVLQAAGYDGITHVGGATMGAAPHRVWIAFDGEQVRSPWGSPVGAPRYGAISIRSGNGMTQDASGSADERANEKLLEVLNRDKQTPASIRNAYQKSQAEGNTPLNLMDLSGENAQGLGRAARAAPSEAKNLIPKVLEARGKEAETRVIGKLIETTGQGRRINLTQSIEKMAEERGKDAEKLYAPIRNTPVDAPEIADALHMEPMKKAYERARSIAKNRAGAQKLLGSGTGEASLPPYAELFDEKTGALKKPLTLGQLDQIKRGLDDMLEKAPRDPLESGGLGREGLGSLRELKNAYVQVLDNAVPGYAEARQTFAGHSAMMKAFDTGKSLFTKSPDEMQALMQDMSQAEQDAFRKGAVEALSQRIEGVTPGNSLSLRVADKTRDRQRLRLLFPDEASFDQFRASIAQEALAHATKSKVLGNSATVDKLAEFADLAGVDLGSVMQQASQPSGMVMSGIKAIAGAAKNRSMASKADALAPKLLASGQSLETVIANLEAASRRLAGKQASRTARTSATAAGLTGTTRRPKP